MKRNARLLLPWFDRKEAIAALLGFRMPSPTEDLSAPQAVYDRLCAARLARPTFEERPAEVSPLPDEIGERGEAALQVYQAGLGSARVRIWTAVIDLTRVLACQKAVILDDIDGRVAAASAEDWRSLADVCLPAPKTGEDDFHAALDKNGGAVTISSFNPNLRAGSVRTFIVPGQTERMVGFPIAFGMPFLVATEYRGRYFLKDGYHRSCGLLARGITRAPAIVWAGRNFGDIHPGGTTLVSQEDLMGPRPPALPDFVDASVSITVQQQLLRKVVRISAEEFVIDV